MEGGVGVLSRKYKPGGEKTVKRKLSIFFIPSITSLQNMHTHTLSLSLSFTERVGVTHTHTLSLSLSEREKECVCVCARARVLFSFSSGKNNGKLTYSFLQNTTVLTAPPPGRWEETDKQQAARPRTVKTNRMSRGKGGGGRWRERLKPNSTGNSTIAKCSMLLSRTVCVSTSLPPILRQTPKECRHLPPTSSSSFNYCVQPTANFSLARLTW